MIEGAFAVIGFIASMMVVGKVVAVSLAWVIDRAVDLLERPRGR